MPDAYRFPHFSSSAFVRDVTDKFARSLPLRSALPSWTSATFGKFAESSLRPVDWLDVARAT
jgi:hypothetical protein